MSGVIEDAVKDFLFQASAPLVASGNRSPDRNKVHVVILDAIDVYISSTQIFTKGLLSPQTPKADVYGLLLPETVTPVQKEKPATTEGVQLRRTANDRGATMRHNRKMRNRSSVVYGESDDTNDDNNTKAAATETTKANTSPVHDMKVKLVRFSPEKSVDQGDDSSDGFFETRQGKVSDLVKQFEEEEEDTKSKRKGSVGSASGSEDAVVARNGESRNKEKSKKRRPTSKAFDMFERSGIIMGMVSPVCLPTSSVNL